MTRPNALRVGKSPAARKLGRAVALQNIPGQRISVVNTTVSSVVAGTSLDGVASVKVFINADQVPAPYLASYASPTVADKVCVLLVDGSPLILGRIAGLPNI